MEPFIDTPVKHYSSGMYLRLAFAVAAHLEPEILLVDEVLAVGDAAFQKTVPGQDGRGRQAKVGRCVFVSHNIEAIQRLCSHAVLLEHGRVAACGDTSSVVTQYLSKDYLRPAPGSRVDLSTFARRGTGEARFASVSYSNGSAVVRGKAYSNGPLEFLLEIDSDVARSVSSLSVFLTEQYGTKVINADTVLINRSITLNPGRNRLKLRMKAIHLTPGVYRVGFWLADPIRAMSVSGAYDYLESAFDIEVVNAELESTAPLGRSGHMRLRGRGVAVSTALSSTTRALRTTCGSTTSGQWTTNASAARSWDHPRRRARQSFRRLSTI